MGTRMKAWPALVLLSVFCFTAKGEQSSAPQATPAQLTLLTYNVLADRWGEEKRIARMCEVLKASEADVIALQEVSPWILERLLQEPWIRARHTTTVVKNFAPGGLWFISKWPIAASRIETLYTRQDRKLLKADIRVGGEVWTFVTAHLESMLEDGLVRADQIGDAFKLLKDAEHGVLLGDFNFGDGEQPESDALPATYLDLWKALRKDEPGYTFDLKLNPMAKAGALPREQSRRIDRILVSSKSWEPADVAIVGNAPIDLEKPDLFPSDHFGLKAILKKKPPATGASDGSARAP